MIFTNHLDPIPTAFWDLALHSYQRCDKVRYIFLLTLQYIQYRIVHKDKYLSMIDECVEHLEAIVFRHEMQWVENHPPKQH